MKSKKNADLPIQIHATGSSFRESGHKNPQTRTKPYACYTAHQPRHDELNHVPPLDVAYAVVRPATQEVLDTGFTTCLRSQAVYIPAFPPVWFDRVAVRARPVGRCL